MSGQLSRPASIGTYYLDKVATILNQDSSSISSLTKSSKRHTTAFTRKISVVNDQGFYSSDLNSTNNLHAFVSITKFIFVFFAARDEDLGPMAVKLVDSCCTDPKERILIEADGSIGTL